MKHVKDYPLYARYYHPKNLEPSKLKIHYTADMAWYIRDFMREYGIKTSREFVKYITRYVKEFAPDIKFYTYNKVNYVRNTPVSIQWNCDLSDETDVDSMAIICYYFENSDSRTRAHCLYSMFQAVRTHLREFEKEGLLYAHDKVEETKREILGKDIALLKVGKSKTYAETMEQAQEKLNKWYEENVELGNRYHLYEEDNKVKIYREL